MENIFMEAGRLKLRFESGAGSLMVEDLWDLPLKRLDTMAVSINKSLNAESESFLEAEENTGDAGVALARLRLEVLKSIITTRQAENKAAKAARDSRAQLEFMNSLLERKQMAKMEELSMEEIQAKIAELQEKA
jgi:hypothetical protein